MGNTQGGSSDGASLAMNEAPNIVPDGYFGVRVSGSPINGALGDKKELEKIIEAAKEEGRKEASREFQGELAKVAQSVYGNVQDQLDQIQEKQAAASKSLIESIKDKLAPSSSPMMYCKDEKATVVNCYKSNLDAPLECALKVDALVACAENIVKNFSKE
eukprot:CAMPEP_0182417334 /NCGR_PEP_ID=MMETSP1167-20130531/1768_1 /TAXON_ID=2988 /ORGANISM="Mallomonas Sp, Strain CCMP3275" /LENGTH=159 /DNA_ID=CAMNT_0024590795 /DNA_START=158 /DNA_END=637 /DNA_ORIENTATION=+